MQEPGTVAHSCNPSAGRQGQVDPRNSLAASLAELGNPGVSERLYFNKKSREKERKILKVDLWFPHACAHSSIPTHICAHTCHTHTNTHMHIPPENYFTKQIRRTYITFTF